MATPVDLRAAIESKIKEGVPSPPGEFHPSDIERRVGDDKYLQRVLAHEEGDLKNATEMLWDILVWRKTVGANDINESNIRLDYVKEGIFFPRGRDVEGSLLLIVKSKMHVKGQKDFEDIKKILIYWLDRIEREEEGKKITLFFDMDGCGLGNMDMELIKYLINLFKLYYPFFLNYILIYQMPWVLNAAFKVVKSLLPTKAVERMKFVNKDSLKQLVTPEQAISCWGGQDDYTFEFVSESSSAENTPKKVTFAEQGDNQHSPGELLSLNPSETIIFRHENEEVCGQFIITNMDEGAISFKIRTTSPEKFRVRPSSGTLARGALQAVTIVVQPGFHLRTVSRDRFLVLAVQIPSTDLGTKELAEIWQKSTGSKVDEYRLKCSIPPERDANRNNANGHANGHGNGHYQNGRERPEVIGNTTNQLVASIEQLQRSVRMMFVVQTVIMIMIAVALVLAYLSQDRTTQDKYCSGI